ncbi:MAG: PAS domain-containing sensor histidine kinase [Promethearchaeota archaeon]
MTIMNEYFNQNDLNLLDHIESLVIVMKDNLTLEFINENVFITNLGYTNENLIEKSFQSFIYEEDLKKFSKYLKKLSKKEKHLIEIRLISHSKKVIWYEVNGKIIYDSHNQRKILLIAKDISRFKKLEIQFRDSENRLKTIANSVPEIRLWRFFQDKKCITAVQRSTEMLGSIIDNIPQILYWKDISGVCIGCNQNFAKINGFEDLNDIIGRKDQEIPLFKNYIKKIKEFERKVLLGKNPILHQVENWIVLSGKEVIFDINVIPITNNKEEIVGFLTTFENITKRVNAENLIRASEEKYRLISENANDLISIVDRDFVNNYINENAFKNILGYEKEEVLGRNVASLLHPDDVEHALTAFNKAFETGEGIEEIRVLHKDGNYLDLEIKGNVFQDSDGTKKALLISRDITERKRAEEKIKELNKLLEQKVEERTKELKESEQNYKDMIDNLDVGFYKGILKGKLLMYNKAFNRILGYSEFENLRGMTATKFFSSPQDQEKYYNSLMEKGKIENFISKIKTNDGREIIVQLNAHLLKNEKGEIVAVEGTFLDITERFELEQKLKESEEKFRNIAEQSIIGIAIIQDGFYKYINDAYCAIVEMSYDKILNAKRNKFIKDIHPEDLPLVLNQIQRRHRENSDIPLQNSYRIITKKKNIKWVDVFSKSFIFQGKRADLITMIDITEKKEAEQKLKESEQKLREQNIELKKLDQLKNDFITMAAHELKTPLISIKGYPDYILEKYNDIPEEMQDDLIRVKANVDRLESYIEDLMDAMTIDAQKLQLSYEEIELNSLIKRCISDLNLAINQKELNIKTNLDEKINVIIDPVRISQVFCNLLMNAIKFSKKNSIIELESKIQNNEVLVKVKDYGKGLAAEQIDKIFGKFVKLNEGFDIDVVIEKGTGLGLYISKGIMEAHGGKIWVESDGLDKGAQFYFTIPIRTVKRDENGK